MRKISGLLLNLIIVFVMFLTGACSGNVEEKPNKKEVTFGEVVDLDSVEKVQMSNNSGTFMLSKQQIEQLKNDLSGMVYRPEFSAKMGSIGIKLTMNGKEFIISSATHGDFIEVHKSILSKHKASIATTDWLYFETAGVNFDNYKK
ncbi:MAG: hypothetical protein ACFHU9_00485 [Fluviicola sp.]